MDHWFLQCQLKPVQLHDEVSPVMKKETFTLQFYSLYKDYLKQ